MRVPGGVVLGVVVGIICGAKFRALLLGRAVFVEIVELPAGEQFGVGPLAVRFLSGSLNTLLFLRRRSGGLGALLMCFNSARRRPPRAPFVEDMRVVW